MPGLAAKGFSQRVVDIVTYSTGNGGSGGSTVFVDVVGFASGRNLVQAYLESNGSPPSAAIEGQILAALKARG